MATQKTFGFIPKQEQMEIYTADGKIYIAQTNDDGSGENDIVEIAPCNVERVILALQDAVAGLSE